MSFFLDLYRVLARTGIAVQLQYRASGAIWMIGSVLEPTIYLVVWTTVAQSQGGTAGGFTPGAFAAYYITTLFVRHLSFSWVMHEFQFRIQQGQFSALLLRPVHPIHGDIADNISYKLVMLVVLLPAALVLALAFRPTFELELWSVAMFLPALLLAFLVRFFVEWSLALAAFWTTRVNAINQTYFAAWIFLSGLVAPIDLLPGWLATLAKVLPFYWVMGFPTELFVGRLSPEEAWTGLGVQLLWAAAALAALSLLWRVAVRRYSAVGA